MTATEMDDHRASLLPTLIASSLEQAINGALRYAPGTQNAISRLHGKRVALILTAPQLHIYLLFERNTVKVTRYCEDKPDLTIEGPLFSVLRQLGFNATAGQLLGSPVNLKGDAQLAQNLAQIIRSTDFDIEEPLSRLFGDVAAHQMGRAIKSAGQWLRRAGRELVNHSGHYLREESGWGITKTELNRFSEQVDQIRFATDRLEARLARLQESFPVQD